MRHHVLLLIITLFCNAATAQTVVQSYPFLNPNTRAEGVTTDNNGDIYVAGRFYASASLAAARSIARKFSPGGQVLWSGELVAGGANTVGGYTCIDAAGNVYVAGNTVGPAFQLQGGPSHATFGSQDVFLAKYTASGALLWSRVYGGSDHDYVRGLGCDGEGNVILAGQTRNSLLSFGNNVSVSYPFITPIQTQIGASFITRITSSGTAINAISLGAYNSSIAVSENGEIYVGGAFPNTNLNYSTAPLEIGATVYPGSIPGMFVARLDTALTPIWARNAWAQNSASVSGIGNCRPYSIGIDTSGSVYMAGVYSGTGIFGSVTLPPSLNPGLTASVANTFVAKYDLNGLLTYAKALVVANAGSSIYTPGQMIIDQDENCLLTGTFTGQFTIGTTTFSSPASQQSIFLGKIDQNGDYVWGITGTSTSNHYIFGLTLDSNDNCYLSGHFYSSNPVISNITFGNYSSTEYGGFLYKIRPGSPINRVTGRIFYDFNSNGIKDGNDLFAQGITGFNQPSSVYFNSSAGGKYTAPLDTGNYLVSIPSPPAYFTPVPGSYSGTFSTGGNLDTARHFALQPIPNQQDLRITLSSPTVPRPGFVYPLHITYKNVGSVTMTGTAQLSLDPLLLFQNSAPAATSQTGNTIHWSFSNLQPQQSATIVVTSTVPPTTPIGTLLTINAQVNPLAGDLTPQDNAVGIRPIVTGSFDPNDKQVSQNWLHPTEVASGKYLDYTIRFQNTGTDTAFTVRIIDTLDIKLNIPTFELLQASHPSTWSIRGNGIIEFRFDNILLPDSNTNEPLSHGFIRYRIRPNTNLALGDVIRNTAGIYFDFNEAIITNTVTTEVALVSGLAITADKPQLQIYPNPNKGAFMLKVQGLVGSEVKAELRNVLGQVVWQSPLPVVNGNVQQAVRTSGLSKGLYYLQVLTEKGKAVQKVVVE